MITLQPIGSKERADIASSQWRSPCQKKNNKKHLFNWIPHEPYVNRPNLGTLQSFCEGRILSSNGGNPQKILRLRVWIRQRSIFLWQFQWFSVIDLKSFRVRLPQQSAFVRRSRQRSSLGSFWANFACVSTRRPAPRGGRQRNSHAKRRRDAAEWGKLQTATGAGFKLLSRNACASCQKMSSKWSSREASINYQHQSKRSTLSLTIKMSLTKKMAPAVNHFRCSDMRDHK